MKKFLLCISICACFLFSSANAADLLQVYKQALKSDPVFKQARATFLATTQTYPQARALLLPNVLFTGQVARNYIKNVKEPSLPVVKSASSTNYTSTEYTITASIPIIDFAAWSTLHQASFLVKQAAASYAAAAQDLILRTASAYFNVLEAEDTLRFTKAQKRATYRQLEQAQQRYKVGLDAITSVYDAQAQYDTIVAEEIAAKNNVVNTKEQLRELTGVYYKHIAPLKKLPLLKPKPNRVEVWIKAADKNNLDLIAQRFAVDAAKENININFAGHLPSLNATASYDRRKGNRRDLPGFGSTRTAMAGLQLNFPIYQGGLVTSQTKQAQYEYEQALAQMDNTYRTTVVQTRQTYNSIIAGISKINADKQAIISQQSALDSTEAALRAGTRTIVDLLLAQQALFQAQSNLSQDQYVYINDLLTFKQLAGTLSASDLKEINTWLATSKTYKKHIYRSNEIKTKHSSHYKRKEHFPRTIPDINSSFIPKIPEIKSLPGKQKQSSAYAIQLMATHDLNYLNKFIKQHGLNKKAVAYNTKINGRNWYILLYGNYATLPDADKALAKLAPSLKKLKPWIKHIPKHTPV